MSQRRVNYLITGLLLIVSCSVQLPRDSVTRADLYGFPETIEAPLPDTSNVDCFLRRIAADTWKYFENCVDHRTGLVVDKIWLAPDEIADYTSITNIGLYLLAVISAEDFGFIDQRTAQQRIRATLHTLRRLPQHNGFFYNWYDLKTLKESRKYVSTVDAAWLCFSLAVVAQTYPIFAKICRDLNEGTDFCWLYDDAHQQFYLGYDAEKGEYSPYHYSLLCSESRICGYWAMMRNQIPVKYWYHQWRTAPDDFEQAQVPEGEIVETLGVRYFKGHYRYKEMKIVPSWGGALFEFLMPGLLIDERNLAPGGIGENNRRAIKAHIDYALTETHFPVWGMSPSTNPQRGYSEYGVPDIGTRKDGYAPDVVSPHASLLALAYDPEVVIANLKRMAAEYPIYGEYGFYDSINPRSREVGRAYLALDQAMILISLNNYLNDGKILKRVEKLAGFETIRDLLMTDNFF